MKQVGRKGITMVALVITVVILALITGVIVNTAVGDEGIITEAEKALREQERKMIIETIAKEIQTEELKKEIQGQYTFTVEEDIAPILQKYGNYDNLTLKLTTTEKGYEIYLYEIMQIPMLEYTQIEYTNNRLTVNSNLISSGYVVEYTPNAGAVWNEYTQTVEIVDTNGIYTRITTGEGKVISDTIKVKEGTIQSEDITPPIIRIASEKMEGQTIEVTIFITEYGILAEDNVYQYYLSTSETMQENGVWKTYTPGQRFTIGNNMEGTYYMHVKAVKDIAGNISDVKVSNAYVIQAGNGNEGGGNVVLPSEPPTVGLSINGNSTPATVQSTTIVVETQGIVLYSYGWSNSKTVAPSEWTSSMNAQEDVSIGEVTGNYYLWIKDLKDAFGNKAETTTVGGVEVNLISEGFNLDNTKPTVNLATNANTTPAKSQSTTIQITDANNVTYKYGWSQNNQTVPTTWTNATNKSQQVTQNIGDGNYYLWIKDLQDSVGNKADTIVVNTNTVNLVSGAFILDNTKPTCTITAASESVTAGQKATYTITFSENVTGLTAGEISVANGDVGTLSGSGASYTLTVINGQVGTQTVTVPSSVCIDTANNTNTQGTKSITVEVPTFANQITKDNYGQAVNYTANGKTDWQIYYKGEVTINGSKEEYIFLIASSSIGNRTLLSSGGNVATANSSNVYKIMKLGQTGYTLNSSNYNSQAVATLVNGYSAYANTDGYKDASGNSYVVGAIGGPTMELVQARANTISLGAVTLGTNTFGYSINGEESADVSTGLPIGSTYIWLASPSCTNADCICYASADSLTRRWIWKQ